MHPDLNIFLEIDLCKIFLLIHGATHDRARLANGFASDFDAKI